MTNSLHVKELQYGDRIIRMEGVIVEVHDGAIAIDLKGRLGHLRIPMRMFISDYPIEVGQEVAWNMSFIEQLGPEVNEKYRNNLYMYTHNQAMMREKNQKTRRNNNEFNIS